MDEVFVGGAVQQVDDGIFCCVAGFVAFGEVNVKRSFFFEDGGLEASDFAEDEGLLRYGNCGGEARTRVRIAFMITVLSHMLAVHTMHRGRQVLDKHRVAFNSIAHHHHRSPGGRRCMHRFRRTHTAAYK